MQNNNQVTNSLIYIPSYIILQPLLLVSSSSSSSVIIVIVINHHQSIIINIISIIIISIIDHHQSSSKSSASSSASSIIINHHQSSIIIIIIISINHQHHNHHHHHHHNECCYLHQLCRSCYTLCQVILSMAYTISLINSALPIAYRAVSSAHIGYTATVLMAIDTNCGYQAACIAVAQLMCASRCNVFLAIQLKWALTRSSPVTDLPSTSVRPLVRSRLPGSKTSDASAGMSRSSGRSDRCRRR